MPIQLRLSTMKTSLALLIAALILLVAAGCGGGGTSEEEDWGVASLTASSGDGQTVKAGSELASPLVVLVTNKSGKPVSGVVVTFRVTSGNGGVFAGSATSDANGLARERWTLGVKASELQRAEARLVSSSGTTLTATFSATAVAGPAVKLIASSGNGQSATQAQPLSSPVLIVAQDSYGNPVAGVEIGLTANSAGSVVPSIATSDTNGQVSAAWTLGVPLGSQVLTATAPGITALELSAVATQAPPGSPHTIQRAAGDMQTVIQHAALSTPLTAWVTDTFGNGVPGVSVLFNPATGSHFKPASVVTSQPLNDAGGYASWKGYFHSAGPQVVEATISTGAKVTFSVLVTPSPHQFDGVYDCYFSARPTVAIRALISNGVVTGEEENDPGHILYSTALNEDTGVFNGNYRASLDDRYTLSGSFAVDGDSEASAAGTYIVLSIGHQTGTGTWACTRR